VAKPVDAQAATEGDRALEGGISTAAIHKIFYKNQIHPNKSLFT